MLAGLGMAWRFNGPCLQAALGELLVLRCVGMACEHLYYRLVETLI